MKKTVFIAIALMSLVSCSLFKPISINPKKDAQMIVAIQLTAKITDSAFKSADLSYAEMLPRYNILSNTYDSIQTVDIVRIRPNNILTIVSNTKKVLKRIMLINQRNGTLSVSDANIYNGQLQAQYTALLTAENALK